MVFTLVLGIFIVCVATTLTSYAEIPLDVLANSPTFPGKSRRRSSVYNKFVPDENLADTSGSAEMEKLDGKQDYGSFDRVVSFDEKPQHVQGNPFVKATVAPSTSPVRGFAQRFVPSIGNIEKTTYVFGQTKKLKENCGTFCLVALFELNTSIDKMGKGFWVTSYIPLIRNNEMHLLKSKSIFFMFS